LTSEREDFADKIVSYRIGKSGMVLRKRENILGQEMEEEAPLDDKKARKMLKEYVLENQTSSVKDLCKIVGTGIISQNELNEILDSAMTKLTSMDIDTFDHTLRQIMLERELRSY
jgi:midasin (ATPase involved in ribosome maturation)